MPQKITERLYLFPLIGLLQGLFIHFVTDEFFTLSDAMTGSSLSLAIFLPALFYLTFEEMPRGRSVLFSAGVSGVLFALIYTTAQRWGLGTGSGDDGGENIWLLSGGAAFIALAYARAYWAEGAERSLHGAAWNSFLALVIAGVFVGVVWLLLTIIWTLFGLIGITFIEEIFEEEIVALPFSFAVAGAGLATVQSYPRTVLAVRGLIFSLFRLITPVVVAVMAVFLVLLPFTGLEPLWNRASPTFTLVSMAVAAIWLINSTLEEEGAPNFPPRLQKLIGLFLLLLPVFGAVGLYCLSLRIGAYGLTPDRIFALAITAFVALTAVAYAVGYVRARAAWWGGMRAANRVLPGVLGLAALVLLTPLVDPYKISAENQYQRLIGGAVSPAELDLGTLQFRMGHAGRGVLARIRADDRFAENEELAQRFAKLGEMQNFYEWQALFAPHPDMRLAQHDENWRAKIEIWPAGATLPEGFEAAFTSPMNYADEQCYLDKDAQCALWVGNIKHGGKDEVLLLMQFPKGESLTFTAFSESGGGTWHVFYTRTYWFEQFPAARGAWDALKNGTVQPTPAPYNVLDFGPGLSLFTPESFDAVRPIVPLRPAEGMRAPEAKPLPEGERAATRR